MKKIITSFFMAWGMFCAIPCPLKRWEKAYYRGMLLALPFIGLMIGAIWSAAAWLLNELDAPVLFAAALLTIMPWLLSGFIHLDGYMDCADAILSRRDLETRRAILKDSHVGSFAVISLIILALLSFSLFGEADMDERWLGLLWIPAVSRCCSATGLLALKPLESSSYSLIGGDKKSIAFAIVLGSVFAAMPLILLWPFGLCGLATAAGSWLGIAYGYRNLGGMSGDISGAAITFGELCGIAALSLL